MSNIQNIAIIDLIKNMIPMIYYPSFLMFSNGHTSFEHEKAASLLKPLFCAFIFDFMKSQAYALLDYVSFQFPKR